MISRAVASLIALLPMTAMGNQQPSSIVAQTSRTVITLGDLNQRLSVAEVAFEGPLDEPVPSEIFRNFVRKLTYETELLQMAADRGIGTTSPLMRRKALMEDLDSLYEAAHSRLVFEKSYVTPEEAATALRNNVIQPIDTQSTSAQLAFVQGRLSGTKRVQILTDVTNRLNSRLPVSIYPGLSAAADETTVVQVGKRVITAGDIRASCLNDKASPNCLSESFSEEGLRSIGKKLQFIEGAIAEGHTLDNYFPQRRETARAIVLALMEKLLLQETTATKVAMKEIFDRNPENWARPITTFTLTMANGTTRIYGGVLPEAIPESESVRVAAAQLSVGNTKDVVALVGTKQTTVTLRVEARAIGVPRFEDILDVLVIDYAKYVEANFQDIFLKEMGFTFTDRVNQVRLGSDGRLYFAETP